MKHPVVVQRIGVKEYRVAVERLENRVELVSLPPKLEEAAIGTSGDTLRANGAPWRKPTTPRITRSQRHRHSLQGLRSPRLQPRNGGSAAQMDLMPLSKSFRA